MAKVTLPNGATITLPDKQVDPGQVVADAVRGAGPGSVAQKKIEGALSPGNFGEAVAQGASFGLSDEISSFLASLSGKDYDTELKASRDRMADYRKRNPLAAFGGELLGGIAVPGIGFSQAMKAGSTLGKAAGLAGAGALAGGMTGFGTGEGGLENRLGGAGKGALIGAVAAPAIVGGANLVGKGVSALLDVTGLGGAGRAETLANRKILQALERAGLSTDDAMKAMQEMQDAGTTPALMDLGQNPARLTASAARVPGQGVEIAADFVESRQLAQGERVANVVDDIFGTNKSAASFIDEINDTQRLAAKPLYAEADVVPLRIDQQVNIGTPEAPRMVSLSDFMQFDDFKNALKRGLRISTLENGAPKVALNPAGNEVPTRLIDLAKKGLDADIAAAMRNDPALARALVRFKGDLLKLVDNLNPKYAEARQVWAGAMELEDAVKAGGEAITKRLDPEGLARIYGGLSPSERPAFRIGVVDALKKVIGEGGDGRNKVLALFGTPNARDRLAAVLGEDEFARLAKFMGFEKAMSKAQGKIAGNSLTAERMADDAGLNKGAVDLLTTAITNPKGAVGNLIRKGIGYTQGLNEQSASSIVKKMTETDPTKLRAILDMLKQFGIQDAARLASPLRSGTTYGVGIGGVGLPGLLSQ